MVGQILYGRITITQASCNDGAQIGSLGVTSDNFNYDAGDCTAPCSLPATQGTLSFIDADDAQIN